jgi:pimeloyl-ACP methyl ester carboxylesterase
MRPDPVVLIHGAWAGAWVWEHPTPLLRERALETVALDLPGGGADRTPAAEVSLESCVARVGAALARLDRRVSLVAHSGCGIVASAVAEAVPDRVARIVYVAGMMLPDGVGFADLVRDSVGAHPEAAGIGPHLVWSEDGTTSRVPDRAAAEIFFHDCPAPLAAAAAARLRPQAQGGGRYARG